MVDIPVRVKEEILHFANRFRAPAANRCKLNYTFPNRLSSDQLDMLESLISRDEVRNAVWGCGENKSPGPTGKILTTCSSVAIGYNSVRLSKEDVAMSSDGFTAVVNKKKKKGKKQEATQSKHIEGLKIHKPKCTFVYRPKHSQPAREQDDVLREVNLDDSQVGKHDEAAASTSDVKNVRLGQPASSEIFRTTGDMSLTFKRCGNFDPFIAKTDATSTTSALEKILSRNGSVVLYVSYRKWHMVELTLDFITVQDYPVDLTSYDYDAPISESGDVDGEKFKGYGRIKLEKTASFFDALDSDLSTEAIESENSISMEAAGQVCLDFYYMLQNTHLKAMGKLSIPKVQDRAQVYVTCLSEDKRAQPEYIGTIDRWSNKHVNLSNVECASSSGLLILKASLNPCGVEYLTYRDYL
ncbi:beta-galactosidase 17 [Tanacetum coccineum]|uniref:Beta-galactosidase 17 n=1 Tax=Tanacetum coccineum TaxID=301880 RepID=A0ABQ5I1G2_9ASTR